MTRTIEPVSPSDIPDLLAMVKGLAEYEKLTHLCVSTEALFHQALFTTPPDAEALIARIDGHAAGFALYCHNFSTFLGKRGLWLEDLFVYPQYRNQGLGKALLKHLAAIAKARDCARFEWAVLDWNQPAIDFYHSLGASMLDEWRIIRTTGQSLDRLAEK